MNVEHLRMNVSHSIYLPLSLSFSPIPIDFEFEFDSMHALEILVSI